MAFQKLKPENFKSLPLERKAEYCLQWKYDGISVPQLAKFFDVSERTIYLWLQKARESALEHLEDQRPVDILIDHMYSLQKYIDMCLYQASKYSEAKPVYDPIKDEITKKAPDHKAFNESMRTLHQFQKTLIDLQQSVGILPKKATEIYHRIADSKDTGTEDEFAQLTSEQQQQRVIEQLQSIRTLRAITDVEQLDERSVGSERSGAEEVITIDRDPKHKD